MGQKAGKGEHNVYKIIPNNNDKGPLTARRHYVGVDAVAWYINKEDNWFTNRMASGTLEITLSNGMEKYKTALGTFEIKGGSKTAPVFDRPVLLDRNYRGGGIGFNASLTAIKKDTVLANVLKSAANASLGIVAGMVDTAAVTGPTQLLTSAGSELVKGVSDILSDKSDKHEPLFDFNGLEFNISANKILGPETYLLFHRGTDLLEDKLDIKVEGETTVPIYNGKSLEDGAWLLLRVKRTSEYPNVRPWFSKRRELKGKVKALVDDVINGFQSKDSAMKQFSFSESGEGTLLDQFGSLRSIILNDGVITEKQALAFTTEITNTMVNARKAIQSSDKTIISTAERAMNAFLAGDTNSMDDSLNAIVTEQIQAIDSIRGFSLLESEGKRGGGGLSIEDLHNIADDLPMTIEELKH